MTQTNDVDRILEAMSREFMEPSFTVKLHWLKIDGNQGITFVTLADLGANRKDFTLLSEEAQLATAQAYYEGTPDSVEIIAGYGACLSAPGYMDATEWNVFPTLDEAKAYIVETYGDDVELDDEEEN